MTIHSDLYSDESTRRTTDALVEMADLALAFGRVARTGPCHPDGTPESDSDHTVMLGWVAPSLAEKINHRMGFQFYDVTRVAAYALVHDAPEVYAGDTCTIRISDDELAAKADREGVATARLYNQFEERLPWFANMVQSYERQVNREARFVRAIDKLLPKMVHLVDKRIGLMRQGVTRADFIALVRRQRKQVDENIRAGGAWVLAIYDLLCDRVLEDWQEDPPARIPQPPAERHWIERHAVGRILYHENCAHGGAPTCPYLVAFEMCKRGKSWPEFLTSQGYHEVALDERGLLIQKEN